MRDIHDERVAVGIIDDDADVRSTLARMLVHLGVEVYTYPSARAYLDDPCGRGACAVLIVDVRLPGISGIELQRQVRAQRRPPALVFVSGYTDTGTVVEAIRNGAVDFLQKPFNEQQLLDSVQVALMRERESRQAEKAREHVAERRARLTPREQDVLAKVLLGLRAKEIAHALGIATKTVEEHRSNIMHKMQTSSVVELVSMFHGAELSPNGTSIPSLDEGGR